MWGPANCLLEENDQQGLAPRVFQQLFARINEVSIQFWFLLKLFEVFGPFL